MLEVKVQKWTNVFLARARYKINKTMKDIKLEKFNQLNILKEVEIKTTSDWKKYRMAQCMCDCWEKITTYYHSVKSWHVKSCWCLNTKWRETHWMRWTSIYAIYWWIICRTSNKKYKHWKHYWWRWIKNEWKNFEEFHKDMWDSYQKWLSIDRVDVNWNYCKDNCRWIPLVDQQDNKQNTVYLNWETMKSWTNRTWLSSSSFYRRVKWSKL